MNSANANPVRIEEQLSALSQPNTHLYALVDLANVVSEAPRIHRWLATSSALCIFGDSSPVAQLASPWLVPLGFKSASNRTLRQTIELANRSSSVSWLVSELAAPQLAQRLRTRTEVRLPDQYGALLRHFDPRVLPVLNQVLTASQRDTFFSLGVAWLYLDRAASLKQIAMKPQPLIDCFSPPLDLDNEQMAALLDAAEIDAVMPELVKEEPDLFLRLGNGPDRYRFTERALQRARQWKLDQFPQKVVFCTLALRFGPDFDEAHAWQEAMGRVAESSLHFADAIQQALNGPDSEPGNRYED